MVVPAEKSLPDCPRSGWVRAWLPASALRLRAPRWPSSNPQECEWWDGGRSDRGPRLFHQKRIAYVGVSRDNAATQGASDGGPKWQSEAEHSKKELATQQVVRKIGSQ